ncbi:hypothetical protein OUZ56_029873 [Daphnia magna]|uniref:Uncharacterized protein n=1 Tax=Daphnia magna TaxID=35525 RepID=A0ABR0B8J6_9CRUS|nr:hypothetical protein OUZ56_029873 [Daphnia magna]
MVSQFIHIDYKSKNFWYHIVFTLNTRLKLMVSQCIHIEDKIKNSWYHSVFTFNTRVKDHEEKTHGITVYSHWIQMYKLMKYKIMVSQCIHIEYKYKLIKSQCIHIEYNKNQWYHSVVTLSTSIFDPVYI